MKRTLLLGLILSLAAGTAFGSIMLKATSFSPTDADFKSIYGSGMTYGGELSFSLSKSLEIWVGASYFSKKGKTTYTQEETKLSLIPVSAGLKWRIGAGKVVSPYLAAGVEYVLYKESAVIGNVSAGGVGFVGKGGLLFQVANFFGIDAQVAYSYCSMKPADFKFNVGGLELGAGIVFIF
jgi:opacity protein-like surface antigen